MHLTYHPQPLDEGGDRPAHVGPSSDLPPIIESPVAWMGDSEAEEVATNVVNLDALIPREDFEVEESQKDWKKSDTLRITDLRAKDFFYDALRKPDFQRETANWPPHKIVDFVKTFLDGDLIPAVILWSGGQSVFIIDGAHRLSALIAWVHDDYGDKEKSRNFFQNYIPREQERAADRTRRLMNETLGAYVEHVIALEHPDQADAEIHRRAKRMSSLALQLQWVPGGDAKKAEASFFKINQEATAIDPTELRILRARRSPNALAARVIVRNATGHKYWSAFNESARKEIEEIGREIYQILYHPELETPIKTLDLPVAGRGYSGQTLPLILDLVNIANGLPVIDATKRGRKEEIPPPDEDGTKTTSFLKNARSLVYRIASTHPSSLGLHPAVYFYSSAGRFQPTSFLAVTSWIKKLAAANRLAEFTKVRKDFEEFLLANKTFVNQIVTKRGSGAKGFDWVEGFFSLCVAAFQEGKDSTAIIDALRKDERFSFLSPVEPDDGQSRAKGKLTRDNKSATFLRDALGNSLRCAICGARTHFKSIQIDHVVRRRDGGADSVENTQLAHPYCNSTYKQ